MNYFPAPDHIPLPAPVWLFKVLHNLTLVLHLAAVEILIGGLALGLALSIAARFKQNANFTQTAGMLAHRLPTVMAFVINLGVPPLLFAQVLYGRALYTSSVLIGAYWIAVIFLLMASYYGLYYSARRAEEKRSWTGTGCAALLLVLAIAFIYSNNMTLMLRPQAWAEMYRNSPHGVQWNTADPTLWPRWWFFVLGSFAATGATLMLLAQRPHFGHVRGFLLRTGGVTAVIGMVGQGALVSPIVNAQPQGVMPAVMDNPVYSLSAYAWIATAVLLVAAGAFATQARGSGRLPAMSAALAVFLNIAAVVMVRDGVRDVTLRAAGFEVWDRQVVANWSVVGLFLALFVLALGAVSYLIRVIAKARAIEERYA